MGELKKPNKNPNELIPPLNDEENALDEAIRNKVIEIADTYWK
jgi:hypothetical protein